MVRNQSFADPQWQPSGPTLALRDTSVRGPFSFMNPTTALYEIKSNDQPGGRREDLTDLTDAEAQKRAKVQWNARDYRKGRHVLVLPRSSPLAAQLENISGSHKVLRGIGRMFTLFPYWDISWLIGISFTIGCLIFVACGLFYWLPIAYPETEFSGESSIAGGVCAFVGATLFQVGAILLFLEAYNDRAETKFGGAMENLFVDRLHMARRSRNHRPKHYEMPKDSDEETLKNGSDAAPASPPAADGGDHGNENGHASPAAEKKDVAADALAPSVSREEERYGFSERSWQWLPTWHDFRTHYIYEIGFLASMTMSIGATIFYACGILALPGIFDKLSDAALEGAYYFCYLFGGVLFSASSILYILENQPTWYTPQPFKIGWHVGVWNLVGAAGWTLAASLGYCKPDWCEYQSELTLVWASAAFSIGSAIQWYESLDKYVVVFED